ncbi:hypothetical protein HC928_17955 [bacterium]|nr:hypothetical protein [bacterium]
MNDDTFPRSVPRRLPNGLLAWQATVGYISTHHSPDALLEFAAYPAQDNNRVCWSSQISWAKSLEIIRDAAALEDALAALWQTLAREHLIFFSDEDALRQPSGYATGQWLDTFTGQILERLVATAQVVLVGIGGLWRFISPPKCLTCGCRCALWRGMVRFQQVGAGRRC